MRKKTSLKLLTLISTLTFGILSVVTVNDFMIRNVKNIFGSVASHTHNGNHYIGKEATCTEDGALEYWVCCDCHQVFFDSNSSDVLTGQWTDTGCTGDVGIGGLHSEAFVPALGHDWHYEYIDDNHHSKICSRCDLSEIEECSYVVNTISPTGLRRGYTSHECEECNYTYYDNFDFSLYNGATFDESNKHLIPYSFTNKTYTIEASIHLPTSFSGRGGVIVGSYGLNECINLEIYNNGCPRVYIVSNKITHDHIFTTDIRSAGIVNLAVTIQSEQQICLYINGILKETISIDYVVPAIGRSLTVGGDYRNLNNMYFRGTLYALSIYKDVRTSQEMVNDIIFADTGNSDYCVSYNLVDNSYLTGDTPGDDPLEYAEVTNLDELIYHCSIGTSEIKIKNNIVVDRTIYILGHVTIYSDSDYSLVREENFASDIFVVGENSVGRNLILDDIECILTLGKDDATGVLTVDGNKDNVAVEVNGALIYISYSGIFNLREHAELINNKKISNSRSYVMDSDVARKLGGAGVLITNGTFNMYGGEISGCSSNTINLDEDTESDNYLVSTWGGAICNYQSNFNMYGGIITGNESYYGGALTNFGVTNICAGTLSNNSSTHAGGTIYQYSSAICSITVGNSDLEAGVYDVVFDSNSSTSYAGAIYAGYRGTIEIIGGVKFTNNTATSTGGAIRTNNYINIDGDNLFKGNRSTGSTGGALYIDYQDNNDSVSRCFCTIDGATFEDNYSHGSGGAFAATGSNVTLTNCIFKNNIAKTNGGAAYITYNSSENKKNAIVTFNGCDFDNNSAAEAGAVFVEVNQKVYLNNSNLSNNSASGNGGAISMHGASLVSVSNSTINNNVAENSAGAIYISYRSVKTTEIIDNEEQEITTVIDSKANISNTSFIENHATNVGGAICTYVSNHGTDVLTLTGSTFTGNSTNSNAGAIYFSNGSATIENNSFNNNVAGDNEKAVDGGALYFTSSSIALGSNTFNSNSSTRDGGAIYANNSNLTLVSNEFILNSSTRYGGALAIFGGTTSNLNGDTFNNNVGLQGGAIYTNGSTIVGDDLDFNSNEATSTSYGGGAIYSTNSSITVSSSTFTDNSSTNYGGAIEGHTNSTFVLSDINATGNSAVSEGGFAFVNNSSLTINENSTISNNTAGTHGGAIVARNGASVTLNNSTISSNVATQNGGGLYINSSTFNSNGGLFTDNVSHSSVNGGGAVYSTGSTITISSSSFIGNSADLNGGAVCGWTNSNITLTGIVGESNSAYSGGFGYATAGATITINGNSIIGGDTVAKGNTSVNGGGALYVSGTGIINASYTTFNNNSSSNAGGGTLYVKDGGTMNVSNCSISNSNGTYGGAMTIYGGTANVENSTFSYNTCTGFGGAIYIRESTGYTTSVEFGNCSFVNNTSPDSAGAIYINSNVDVTFVGCDFNNNEAVTTAGAIFIKGSDILLDNCTFDSNIATTNGGAMYIESGTVTLDGIIGNENSARNGGFAYNLGTLVIRNNSNFNGNIAINGGGGAIYSSGNSSITINDSEFTNNTASSSGGAIYIYYNVIATLTDTTFENNNALYGGAIIINGGNATFTRCEFNANSTNGSGALGGALYIRDYNEYISSVTFNNTSFTANSSDGTGGAIHIKDNSSMTINNCEFIDNASSTNGGAIYAQATATVNIDDSTFTNNTALYGGSIYGVANVDINVNDSSFINNSSTSTNDDAGGGAIYIIGTSTSSRATLDIINSTFIGNTAKNGGAIYMKFVNCNTQSIILSSNSATSNAGAMYIHTSTLDIKSITATGNSASLGGVFYVNRSTVTINQDGTGVVLFGTTDNNEAGTLKNSATSSGGVFYITVGGDVTINNSTFGYNSALKGGAVTGSNANGCTIVINNSTFIGNSATSTSANNGGGAIYGEGAASITTNNCTFTSNTSGNNGGAIYIKDTATYIDTGSSFTTNSASSGGAIRSEGASYVTITNATFTSNTATGNGGAIYFYNDGTHTNTLTGCSFISNNASGSLGGGAIYNSSASKTIIENTIMRNNTAKNGGAIYTTNGSGLTTTFEIKGTYVTSNNNIYVGSGSYVTINSSGLDDEDNAHASNTWSSLIKGTIANVTYN